MSYARTCNIQCQKCKTWFLGRKNQKFCCKKCNKESEKTCRHCSNKYSNSELKDSCWSCHDLLKEYNTTKPLHMYRNCKLCEKEFFSKSWKQTFCSKQCYKTEHRKNKRIAYRIQNNISLSLPVKIKNPNGTGHKEKQGYRFINKMRHPNASKSGRIYEHIFIMSEYLGRPLIKGETVHHKNGIRDDNRIENLELWSSSHPGGQRVKDKIDWCLEFLSKYGELSWTQKKEFSISELAEIEGSQPSD